MDRRAFLTGLPVAPVLLPLLSLPTLASAPTTGITINSQRDGDKHLEDPAYKLWVQHRGVFAGQWRVLLNGVSQMFFKAANEVEGWVIRDITVGDVQDVSMLCLDMDDWAEEKVYGKVEIIPLVTEDAVKSYPFDTVRDRIPILYSRLKIEGVNCPVGYYS